MLVRGYHFLAAPGDYVPLVDVPLSFLIGAPLNSTYCVNITINDDLIVEYDEEFSVYLLSYDPVIIDPIYEANVTIMDNDCKCRSQQFLYIYYHGDPFLLSCYG